MKNPLESLKNLSRDNTGRFNSTHKPTVVTFALVTSKSRLDTARLVVKNELIGLLFLMTLEILLKIHIELLQHVFSHHQSHHAKSQIHSLTDFIKKLTRVTDGWFNEKILFSICSAETLSSFFIGWCFLIRITITFHLQSSLKYSRNKTILTLVRRSTVQY